MLALNLSTHLDFNLQFLDLNHSLINFPQSCTFSHSCTSPMAINFFLCSFTNGIFLQTFVEHISILFEFGLFFSYVAKNSLICPSWTSKTSLRFMFSSSNLSFFILVSFNCLTKFPMVFFNSNTPCFNLFKFFYDHKCGFNPMPMCSNPWSMQSSPFCLTSPSRKWLMLCWFVSIIGNV